MNATPFDPFALWPDPPRDWQRRAYDTMWPIIRSREPTVMQACTGAGKTRWQIAIVATALRTLQPGWVVVVSAPKQDLVEQTHAAMVEVLGGHECGTWYGRDKVIGRVTVACHDSMRSLSDALRAKQLRVALWMADECHRADVADVLTAVETMAPVCRVGLSATPYRSDKTLPLSGWTRCAFSYPVDQAVEEGVLVPYRPVLPRATDDVEDLDKLVLEMIRRDAPPGPGIVSATDIDDADYYAEYLSASGIPAASIHSGKGMSKAKRAKLRADLLRGKYRCLVHVDLLTEGVDIPPIRWLAERRDRGSALGIVQAGGRVLRPCKPDQWGTKTEAVLLFPHETPFLRSLAREPNLVARAAALAREAEREVEEATKTASVMPPGVAAIEVGDWLGLLRAAVALRIQMPKPYVDPADPDGAWRARWPTSKQVAFLETLTQPRNRSGMKFLPPPHRKAVAKLLARLELLTSGGCSDLIDVISGLRRAGSDYAKANRFKPVDAGRYWPGLGTLDGADPPDSAVKAMSRKARG